MEKVSFRMSDVQPKKWFIAWLAPCITMPSMQQNIMTQIETLEIAMKLEASPVEETGIGMSQI